MRPRPAAHRVLLAVSWDSPYRDGETATDERLVLARGEWIEHVYSRFWGAVLLFCGVDWIGVEYEYGDRGRMQFLRDLKYLQISIPIGDD